jgi:hypothetical protein
MRLRTLLAATAASSMLIAGFAGTVHADPIPSPSTAGTVVAWGDPSNTNTTGALAIPSDLSSPVVDVSTNNNATALVTLDGHLTVLGSTTNELVTAAPTNVTDAVSVTIAFGNVGAVVHADGKVTVWGTGTSPLLDVPTDLRAKAVALTGLGIGYAVRPDGTLATWGADPAEVGADPTPSGLSGLVDVSASNYQIMALKADGTVLVWGLSAFFPNLVTVPDFGGKKVTQISAGTNANGVLFEDGSIQLWGNTVPTGQPDFGDHKVVSLSVGSFNAGAITDDGVAHTWGPKAPMNANLPASLNGRPVAVLAVGETHAAAIFTTFRELTRSAITGNAELGQTLTVSPATYSLAPDASATGQWYAGDDAIDGQTGSSLVLDDSLQGKSITFRTTATRGWVTLNTSSKLVGPVKRATSTVTLQVTPATATAGTARTVTATVARAGGIPTGTITFKVGNETKTDILSGGKGIWKLPSLAVGTHQITAVYSGDELARPATANQINVGVVKATSKVTLRAKAQGTTVRITVSVATAKGASPAGRATVVLKGKTKKTVHVIVNANGTATVTVKKAKKGKYTANATYAGNASVIGSHGTLKFKV